MEKEKIIKEISQKYGKSEKLIKIMLANAEKLGYNKKDSCIVINEFYNN